MGCDIHIIVEIKKDDKWMYVPERPESYRSRNYRLFAVLADVRNSFDIACFEPKGIPEDISGKQFAWQSEWDFIKNRYETGENLMCVTGDGERISLFGKESDRIRRVITEEEYDELNALNKNNPAEYKKRFNSLGKSWSNGKYEYYVTDAQLVDGTLELIPYKELFANAREFAENNYEDEWNESMQDYGYWGVNFDCTDLHSHSHLSLQELIDFDATDYNRVQCTVPKPFYDKFVELGGRLPDGMSVKEKFEPTDFAALMRQAFAPDVLISWEDTDTATEGAFPKGIKELKQIAEQYGIVDYSDIRIVFAFDN